MDSVNHLRKLLVGEDGVPKSWELMCGLHGLDNKELDSVSGEFFLLKSVEGLLIDVLRNDDGEKVIRKLRDGLKSCQAVLDSVWEKLNTGIWKETPISLRHLYSHASLVKAYILSSVSWHGEHSEDAKEKLERLRAALKTVDYGILLGMPTSDLTTAAQIISKELNEASSSDAFSVEPNLPTEKSGKETLESSKDVPPRLSPDEAQSIEDGTIMDCSTENPWRNWGRPPRMIPVLFKPSLERFFVEHYLQRVPAVLQGCLDHWPALSLWSPMYLAETAGNRTVPIELGPNYVHPAWGQKLMAIGEFVERHMEPEKHSAEAVGKPIGYLAQHPLFDQVPELKNDIKVPEYCCLSEESDSASEGEVDINAWFGPRGTVSPLHHDPKHNLLAQVVGTKRVILYSSDDSKYLHPYDGQLLDNTSQVDPEDPLSLNRFPDISSAQAWECELHAGDMLYIPLRWWHHVRSLSTSFSVSFWW